MIKSKRFSFIAVIVVAMLLVVGNWAVPVQANNAGIATPTATGTPATQPDNPGITASVEQQEELKSIIQSYFAIRYRAFNTLQLDGFGDLVSNGPDAKVFVDAELGKLAVEIKHAKLNHLRYVDYKYFLDFSDIAIDTSSQMATVSVIEENEVIYEISKEHDPEDPIVSRMFDLKHTIGLKKEQGQWKIVSDNYNDYLWRMLRQTGKSTDEMLRTLKASPRPSLQSASTQTESLCILPDDDSIHAYDRAGAVNYALEHAAKENYNPDYPDYDDGAHGDCTNFVSQAIYEGGNASMAIPDPLPSPSPNGQVGWYLLNDTQRASAWNDVGALHDFITHSYSWDEGPEGCSDNVTINDLMLGDVIQYETNGDDIWDHSVIVVGFDGAGDPLVASHSPNIPTTHYTNFDYNTMRFIRIERSDGNPPVKAKIEINSDDAGTNPTGCAFSSSDNEVYLGACFGGGDITSGFRFNNIQIPRNAHIKYAYLTFTVDGTYTVPVSVKVFGEAVGNSVTFTVLNPPENRATTSEDSAVLWDITDQWELGYRRTTLQLSPVIQEIVNRNDWDSGNSLSIIIKNAGSTNVRRVIALERASWDLNLSPAKLIITYSLEGLPTPTATPTATPTSTPTTIPPTPVSTIIPTIAPTLPPQPTSTPCDCFLDWLFGRCTQSSVQVFTIALQNLKNATDDLQLFYHVRDEILSQTPEGRRLIDLYYTYSPEVIQLVQADSNLEAEIRSLIQLWTPNLQALVDGTGDQAVITTEQINATKDFADHLSANASPEFKQAIADILAQHPLERLDNKNMNEAWAYVNGYQLTWRPPLSMANPYVAQAGRTIPVEFTLVDFQDSFVIDESVKLQVVDNDGNIVIGPIGLGSNPTDGIVVQGKKYHYNLRTNGLSAGVYTLQVFYNSATPNEPAVWTIQIKK
ncbi:MAG: amidase domain-containing protein [Chloroflexi bacterium]|nr:amidase domain-containing protein [Chloroflexota bacterium]